MPLQLKDDEELGGALDSLDVSLKENIQLLSSFEKYKKEVLGDSLDWTPMHTSQQVLLASSSQCTVLVFSFSITVQILPKVRFYHKSGVHGSKIQLDVWQHSCLCCCTTSTVFLPTVLALLYMCNCSTFWAQQRQYLHCTQPCPCLLHQVLLA